MIKIFEKRSKKKRKLFIILKCDYYSLRLLYIFLNLIKMVILKGEEA